ncbi:A24 family peptidase [Paenibacillus sp. FSL W7-1287]|uniref:A24 family peptidase n=1 Tax=Paenibacillus sp. FSL W7-1287 TaxID=2954538 RepID=UPI0030FCF93E
MTVMTLHLWLAIGTAAIALYYDVTNFRIPNWLSLSAFSAGVIWHSLIAGGDGLVSSLLGMLTGFVPMLVLYWCKGLGAGDVKLFAALGALLGVSMIIQLMVLSFVFGGVISLLLLGYQSLLKLTKRKHFYSNALLVEVPSSERLMLLGLFKLHQFPFMLAVAPAMAIVWLFPGVQV